MTGWIASFLATRASAEMLTGEPPELAALEVLAYRLSIAVAEWVARRLGGWV